MSKVNEIENEQVKKLLFKFSMPAIIAMLANALYNVCDRLFVGMGVGVLGISAISIAYTVTLIIMGFSMLVGLGATSLVSIKLGEKDTEACENIVGNTFVLIFIVSGILMILGYVFLTPILVSLGAKGKVLYYTKIYTEIIILGIPFQVLSYTMNNILKGQGRAKRAMVNLLVSVILNTILNPLFIFVFKMGIAGSALATVISTAISSTLPTSTYFTKGALIKIHVKNLKLRKNIIKESLSMGISGFIMQVSMSLIVIIINKQCLVYGGDNAVAVFGILNSFSLLIYMPIYGISQGMQPIIGYSYGAKKHDKLLETLKLSTISATIFAVIAFIAFEVFSKNIFSAFAKGTEAIINMGVPAIRMYSISIPLFGIIIIFSTYFQYIGKAKYAIILTLLRQVIIIIPLLFIVPKFMGRNGIWLANPITDVITAVLAIGLVYFEIKNIKTVKTQLYI